MPGDLFILNGEES